MGTYALSAGYYDAYYKRAQQVGNDFNELTLFTISLLHVKPTLNFVFHIVNWLAISLKHNLVHLILEILSEECKVGLIFLDNKFCCMKKIDKYSGIFRLGP